MSAACVVAVVIIGMLIMTRTLTVEQVTKAVGRGLLVLTGGLMTLCVFKVLLASVVIPRLLSLKSLLGWLAVVVLGTIIAVLIARVMLSKFQG